MESTCRSRILFYIVDLRDFCPRIQSETNKFYYLDVAEWGRYPAIAPKVLSSSLTLKIFVLCETPVSKVANQALACRAPWGGRTPPLVETSRPTRSPCPRGDGVRCGWRKGCKWLKPMFFLGRKYEGVWPKTGFQGQWTVFFMLGRSRRAQKVFSGKGWSWSSLACLPNVCGQPSLFTTIANEPFPHISLICLYCMAQTKDPRLHTNLLGDVRLTRQPVLIQIYVS